MSADGVNPVFRALAAPTRRAIFAELSSKGEQTVHALTSFAGVSQPAVSKHLSVLQRARLVRHRRDGRETHYRAQPEALEPVVQCSVTMALSGRTALIVWTLCWKGWTREPIDRTNPQRGN